MSRTKRRSAVQWSEIVREYESGGETKGHFCHKHGIGISTLDKWRRRLLSSTTPVIPAVSRRSGFVRVNRESDVEGLQIILQTAEGVKVSCPLVMGIEAIARLSRLLVDEH